MRYCMLGVLIASLFVTACSGAQPVDPVDPVISVEPEKPKLITNDPFDKRLNLFETTYKALVCRANRDYDPMGNIGMISEPYADIVRYREEGSSSVEPFELIMKKNGYESVDAFLADRKRIMEAKRGWWEDLTGKLFDFLEECSK
jgi:hypothetical protein